MPGTQRGRRQKGVLSTTMKDAVADGFVLRIGFTGLCLFATPKRGPIYVLLPDVAEYHGMPRHVARFLDGVDDPIVVDKEIDLGRLKLDPMTLEDYLPAVGDLSPHGAGGVRSAMLTGQLPDSVQARIVLPKGCVTAYNPGARWQSLCERPFGQYLSSFVVWAMLIKGTELRVSDLTGTPSPKVLRPSGGVVDVYFTNLPLTTGSAEHFAGYGAMLEGFDGYPEGGWGEDKGLVRGPGAAWLQDAELPPFPAHRHGEADFMTCMLGRARVI